MTIDVRNVPELSRYEVTLDGALVGLADYVVVGSTVAIPHTEVDPSVRGQGIAAALVRFALDDIRAAGRRVDPQCPYVRTFIDRHPADADLVDRLG
jgi:predicted GNAT family acetyltransferase